MDIAKAELNAATRANALRQMGGEILDVLVVGAGVVGAGVALDAATRGLNTGLVDARDIAAGTSSHSSKLIHGGLRYLEQFDFTLVREALRERGLLLEKIAPHLVTPVQFLLPLTHRFYERPYVGSGVALYDVMAHTSGRAGALPWHRHLSRRQAVQRFAGLRDDVLAGAISYYDAQVDDARFTINVARTAAAHGAHVATRVRVTEFLREGERVVGARVRDLESPEAFVDVRAHRVINATGVWTDESQALVTDHATMSVRMSKGVHLVVARSAIDGTGGLILRTSKSVLFVIPWGEFWIIGTTDTEWNFDKVRPAATRRDVEYLLELVNSVLRRPLGGEDVLAVYAGLRPLVDAKKGSTTTLSREHVIVQPVAGLTVIAGGKFTTYRVMARDAVDAACHDGGPTPESRTADVPLVGAHDFARLCLLRGDLAREFGIDESKVQHLLSRYGDQVRAVLKPTARRPDLLRPLGAAPGYLRCEVLYAMTSELALHLGDVIERRTRISIETRHRGSDALEEVASLMGEQLGWSDSLLREEIDHSRRLAEGEEMARNVDDDIDASRIMGEMK
jgi:glycerol-3-phosphate dehydrogenase